MNTSAGTAFEKPTSASGFGRRGFFALGLAAGSAAFLAACGDSDSAASVSSGGGQGGGTLKFGWALVTSWDPVTSSAGWDVHALSLVYTGLTKLDEKANAVPALARWRSLTSPEIALLTDDNHHPATALEIKLRHGSLWVHPDERNLDQIYRQLTDCGSGDTVIP